MHQTWLMVISFFLLSTLMTEGTACGGNQDQFSKLHGVWTIDLVKTVDNMSRDAKERWNFNRDTVKIEDFVGQSSRELAIDVNGMLVSELQTGRTCQIVIVENDGKNISLDSCFVRLHIVIENDNTLLLKNDFGPNYYLRKIHDEPWEFYQKNVENPFPKPIRKYDKKTANSLSNSSPGLLGKIIEAVGSNNRQFVNDFVDKRFELELAIPQASTQFHGKDSYQTESLKSIRTVTPVIINSTTEYFKVDLGMALDEMEKIRCDSQSPMVWTTVSAKFKSYNDDTIIFRLDQDPLTVKFSETPYWEILPEKWQEWIKLQSNMIRLATTVYHMDQNKVPENSESLESYGYRSNPFLKTDFTLKSKPDGQKSLMVEITSVDGNHKIVIDDLIR